MTEQRELRVDDTVVLEAELAPATSAPIAAAVLCHPHPQYGGTMRSIVISELFRALPERGVTCLRFNFRGVEGSTGTHDHGIGERDDVVAAITSLAAEAPDVPLILAGWSFGADVSLSILDDRIAAWFAVAPPMRTPVDMQAVGADPRPKRLVLAEHDEVRAPEEIEREVTSWQATTIDLISGASHFFMGRTDHVVAAADRLLTEVAR